jgi:protease-4
MKTFKSLFLMVVTALSLALTQNVWAIDHDFAMAHMSMVNNYLQGKYESSASDRIERINRLKCQAYFVETKYSKVNKSGTVFESFTSLLDVAPAGSIAIIPISGAIMKEDYCGWAGTETLARWTQEADNHPNIIGIIHLTNTPGGACDAMFQMADATKAIQKPLLNFSEGMCCSAGQGIASGANERWASHSSTMIGSIGTMLRLVDYSGAYKQSGIVEHIINADSSPDKNNDYAEAKKGNYTLVKESILNPLNDIFLSYMRNNLSDLKEGKPVGEGLPGEPLTGKVYLAETAKSFGLIDQIGTLQQAVERVKQLADSNYKIKLV